MLPDDMNPGEGTGSDTMATRIPTHRAPAHPGEILERQFLEPLGMTQTELSRRLDVPFKRVNEIVNGKRSVTAETALLLARLFGTSAEFWLGLQKEFELRKAREELGATIDKEVVPLSLAS